jgi:hypothetical protein
MAEVGGNRTAIDYMKQKIVYVDVDETLVRSAGTKRIPMTIVIRAVRRMKEEGALLYLWSSGGAEYARASAAELGIDDCSVGYLPKPNVIIDDQPVAQWRGTTHVYPLQTESA